MGGIARCDRSTRGVIADAAATSHAAARRALPFDLSEVVVNLQQERYRHTNVRTSILRLTAAAVRRLYYLSGRCCRYRVRKHLQRSV